MTACRDAAPAAQSADEWSAIAGECVGTGERASECADANDRGDDGMTAPADARGDGRAAAPCAIAQDAPAWNAATQDVPASAPDQGAAYGPVVGDDQPSAGGASDVHGARVRSIFSEIARRYELFNTLSSFGIYRRWLGVTARAAACGANDRVLDVAGGTGDVSFKLCECCPPGSIELTDFTPEMLEVARERARAGANRGVPMRYAEVDAHNLPYEDASFTLVTCAYGLRNFTDRRRAMREAARVLAPDGRYVVLEFATPPNPVWRALYRVYLNHMIPLLGGLITGDRAGFEYLRDSIKGFPPQATIAQELREAGFAEVRWRDCTGGIVAVYTAVKSRS